MRSRAVEVSGQGFIPAAADYTICQLECDGVWGLSSPFHTAFYADAVMDGLVLCSTPAIVFPLNMTDDYLNCSISILNFGSYDIDNAAWSNALPYLVYCECRRCVLYSQLA